MKMKRMMMLCFAIVLFGSSAWAESDNAAYIFVDGDDWEGRCWLRATIDEATYEAFGELHYVEVKNGIWSLECRGLLTEDEETKAPKRAIVVKSTAETPLMSCARGWFGPPPWDMHLTLTPSGRMILSCHGTVDPD